MWNLLFLRRPPFAFMRRIPPHKSMLQGKGNVSGKKSPNLSNTVPQRKITVRGMTPSHILERTFSSWMTLRLFFWTLLQVSHKSILRSRQASLRFLIMTSVQASEEEKHLHRQTTLQASVTVSCTKIWFKQMTKHLKIILVLFLLFRFEPIKKMIQTLNFYLRHTKSTWKSNFRIHGGHHTG